MHKEHPTVLILVRIKFHFNTIFLLTNISFLGTLYIRRRSQLLRESEGSPEKWKEYLRLRTNLLQQRYGNPLENAYSSTPSLIYYSGSRVSYLKSRTACICILESFFRPAKVVTTVQQFYCLQAVA